MAKKTPNYVGLEIEPSAVHAVAVGGSGALSVKDAAVAPLEQGIVRDGEVDDVNGLTEALKALFAEHKALPKRVRIGIANQKIVVRVIELPPITDAKELDAAVRFSAQEHLPMPLDGAVLDFQALGVVDTPAGPRQRVMLVAARRDMVDKVLSAARGAGLKVEGLDLAAFGMVRALAPGGTGDEPVLYLSVGGLTNLALARGTHCEFTRVVGGGLEAVAVELAGRRGLTHEHARGWLTHVGLEMPLEDVDGDPEVAAETRQVLADGVRRIAGEVRNTIDYHLSQSELGTAPVERCVLTGAASGVPGFADALADELHMQVRVGEVSGAQAYAGITEPGRLTIAAGLAVEEAAA